MYTTDVQGPKTTIPLLSFDCDFDKVTCNLLQRNHCLYLEIHKLSDHCPPESVMTYCGKSPWFLLCCSQGAFLPVTLATEQLTEQANHRSKVGLRPSPIRSLGHALNSCQRFPDSSSAIVGDLFSKVIEPLMQSCV